MTTIRRKSSSHSDSSPTHQHSPQHHHQHEGFLIKLINDVRRLYYYETHQIKWMNEKPKPKKAYEPTEV